MGVQPVGVRTGVVDASALPVPVGAATRTDCPAASASIDPRGRTRLAAALGSPRRRRMGSGPGLMNLGEGPFRIGVDIGGTFSDFVILDEASGDVGVLKVPSTPREPSDAVLAGLARLAET